MRPGQRILLLLAGLVGLLLIGVLVFVATFDPNDHRDGIERLVSEQTGREFELEGDIELALFPRLAIEAGPARLGDARGFGPEPFLTVERVALQMRLLPLLSGRVEIGDLHLDGPALRLIVDSDGVGNWSDLAGGGQGRRDGGSLSIGGLFVTGGRLLIEDRAAGRSYVVRDLDLEMGRFAFGRSVPVEMSLLVEHPDAAARVAIATSMTIVAQPLEFDLDEPRVDVELLGEALGLTGLTARLRAVHAGGTADRGLLESFSLDARPRTERWPDGVPVQLEAARIVADLSAQTGDVEKFDLDVAGATLAAPALRAERLLDDVRIGGAIRLEAPDLRDWLRRLGIEVPAGDPAAFGRVALEGRLALTPERVALDDLVLELDAIRTTGWLAVAGIEQPAIRFDLEANAIDLDRYLPPQEPDAPPDEIPVAWLRELDVAGDLRIARARIADVEVDGIRLVLESGDRAVHVQQPVATLESGAGRPAS